MDRSELRYCQVPKAVETYSLYTHIQYLHMCVCIGRFSPRGSAVGHEIPPVTHLGTHENGNGSGWSVDGDQSVFSSGLFIKVKHCPLDPVILSHPAPYTTLRCNSTHCLNSSWVLTEAWNVRCALVADSSGCKSCSRNTAVPRGAVSHIPANRNL